MQCKLIGEVCDADEFSPFDLALWKAIIYDIFWINVQIKCKLME